MLSTSTVSSSNALPDSVIISCKNTSFITGTASESIDLQRDKWTFIDLNIKQSSDWTIPFKSNAIGLHFVSVLWKCEIKCTMLLREIKGLKFLVEIFHFHFKALALLQNIVTSVWHVTFVALLYVVY